MYVSFFSSAIGLFIPQCPANLNTSRMNVCSFLVPPRFQTTRSARMEQSIGMNGHRTDKSHTPVVRGVLDLIAAQPIVVLDSAVKGSGSGSRSYYCPFGFRRWYYYFHRSGMARACVFFFRRRLFKSNPFSASERFDY
jgi:hypothetical protein